MRALHFGWLVVAGSILLANCAPKPTSKEMDGKVKGKASLRLADGSTISQDGSDEYNPYLLRLDDGYLVLVFGSNRNGYHNIYVTKSLAPYDGFEIPFFNPPVAVTISSSPIDDLSPITFAAYVKNSNVALAFNYHSVSQIRTATITDPNTPDIASLTTPDNSGHYTDSIIGVSSDGSRLFGTDGSGVAYSFDPAATDNSGEALGAYFDYSESLTQVRFDNTGFNDSFMGTYYYSTFAATKDFPFGPMFEFDFSLSGSGLYISHLSTFYGASAYEDLVLFSANDGISDDIYVVTSHTSGMLWATVAFFGGESYAANAPFPDHYFSFESATCGQDFGWDGTWSGTCNLTPNSGSFDLTDFAPFTSTENMTLGSVDFDPFAFGYTISAWILVDSACNSANCTIISNATNTTTDGFWLSYDGTSDSLKFWTRSSGVSTFAESISSIIPEDGLTWQHVAVVVDTLSGTATLYINGFPFSISNSTEMGFPTNAATFVGQMGGGTEPFRGGIDDLMIFGYPLSDPEILALSVPF